MDALGIERFHVVAAKIGGTAARRLASRFPDRVITLTVAGTPAPYRDTVAACAEAWSKEIQANGIESWARRTMAGRLGDDFPEEGVAWWVKLMGRTAPSSVLGSLLPIPSTDHVAASHADRCARETLDFIRSHSRQESQRISARRVRTIGRDPICEHCDVPLMSMRPFQCAVWCRCR